MSTISRFFVYIFQIWQTFFYILVCYYLCMQSYRSTFWLNKRTCSFFSTSLHRQIILHEMFRGVMILCLHPEREIACTHVSSYSRTCIHSGRKYTEKIAISYNRYILSIKKKSPSILQDQEAFSGKNSTSGRH